MASQRRLTNQLAEPQPLSPRELVEKYSGLGLQFRVKYVGSENINRKRGDAEAARYCIPTLRIASKNMGAHKPKAVLGLSLKGISLYDERSKSVTRVPVEKITYVSHDPEDLCYFGIIIQTKESHTGFRLYCFKAEKSVATTFVTSARELFDLMLKLREAKKKLKEEREAATQETDSDKSNLPPENAPPPSYTSVVKEPGPPERPPPPCPKQAPAIPPRPEENMFDFSNKPPESSPFDDVYEIFDPTQKSQQTQRQSTMDEWQKLEGELNNIAKNLPNMPRQPSVAEEYVLLPPPAGGIQRPQPFGAKPPPPKEPPPPDTGLGELEDIFSGGSSMLPPLPEINTTLNPFGATQAPPPPTYPPSQPSYPLGPSMTPQEPSITMDLMDAVRNPPPGTTSYPQGMGMGPFGGPQYPGQQFPGTSFGGGPYVGTGPFATGSGSGLYGNIPGVPAPNDIFSMPADPLLDTTFSQPLLPTNTQKTDTASGGPKGQGGSGGDAFSDLVSMARNKASATTAASTKSVEFLPVRSSPPPLPYRPPNLGQESTDRGRLKPEMLFPFEENFSTGKQTPPLPLHQSLSDPFGDNFTFSQAPPPESFPQSSGGGGWVSF